jgi:aminoglycoside phosphotransferase family enzyme/predicted kinase
MQEDAAHRLITALRDPARYPHPVDRVELVETHISWVLLTGDFAYKIKKPVDLGFLDFSTLEKRHHYCIEELRLNRRLAPQLYLDVIAIGGTPAAPVFGAGGAPLEYAVRMRQFPESARLDRLLAEGRVEAHHIDQLADLLARFHAHADTAPDDSPYGTAEAVYAPVAENFAQIRALVADSAERKRLEHLERWSQGVFRSLAHTFAARRERGFVRECHGDAHLANMVLLDDEVVLFDCLEFNPALRWIDVLSEVAFSTMDLDDRRRPDYARRLLDRYLQRTGDYEGMAVFRFFQVYRALVRAKVAAIRLGQRDIDAAARGAAETLYRSYANLAEQYTRIQRPRLVITRGVSGTGKTTITQSLLEAFTALRIRSDVERKRLFGLEAEQRPDAAMAQTLYGLDANTRTYARLESLADTLLAYGYSVIVDAAFLKRDERARFAALAERHGVAFVILDIRADAEVLRQRLWDRSRQGADASDAGIEVLEQQLVRAEALAPAEMSHTFAVDGDRPPDGATLAQQVRDIPYI